MGILPVVDNDQVSGVITDRDIFRAFLEVSGYGEEGVRVRFVTEDKVGVLEQIIHLIVEEGYNIANTVNIPTKDDRVVIEVQIDGVTDLEGIRSKFEANGLRKSMRSSEQPQKLFNKNQARWKSSLIF